MTVTATIKCRRRQMRQGRKARSAYANRTKAEGKK